jgi:hypothetical protein
MAAAHKVLSLVLAMLLLGRLAVAGACQSSDPQSDEQLFANASTVFIGHIFRIEEAEAPLKVKGANGSRAFPAVEATFRLVEVLKGEPPADRKVRDFVAHFDTCLRPLVVGYDYLVFLNEGSNAVVWEFDAGTRILFDSWKVEDKLCQGRQCVLDCTLPRDCYIARFTRSTMRSTLGMAASSRTSAAGRGMCGVVMRTGGPSRS